MGDDAGQYRPGCSHFVPEAMPPEQKFTNFLAHKKNLEIGLLWFNRS